MANARNTLSTDLIIGRQLWQGAEFILDASVTRGFGLSNSVGVANFPSNEAFRLGTTDPFFFVPRAFLRQTIGLSGDTVEDVNALRFGTTRPRERLTIPIGKFSVWDIFDDNLYAHDAHSNSSAGRWSAPAPSTSRPMRAAGPTAPRSNGTMANGGCAAELPGRAPTPTGSSSTPSVTRAFQGIAQVDRFFRIAGQPGAVRFLYGYSQARQSTWNELLRQRLSTTLRRTPIAYHGKHNLAFNAEQQIIDWVGIFTRLSWNDGVTQNWMYTEMDRDGLAACP